MENEKMQERLQSVRERSPNYPTIGLPEAIKKIKAIYQQERRSSMPSEVAVKHLGYTSLNGHARSVLSALKKYGLLISDRGQGQVRVSDDAVTICVYQEGAPERSEAIKRVAQKPEIFREILKEFPDGLGSEANLRAKLITRRGFTEAAANTFIRALKETVQLADSGIMRNNDPEVTLDSEPLPMTEPNTIRESSIIPPPSASKDAKDIPYFRFTAEGATVEFRASAPLTKKHFDLIKAYMTLLEGQTADSGAATAVPPISQASASVAQPAKQEPPLNDKVASVGFMITKAQKARLRERGHTDDEIAKMRPETAHKILGIN
jgi:hypothetical protein